MVGNVPLGTSILIGSNWNRIIKVVRKFHDLCLIIFTLQDPFYHGLGN